MNVFPAFRSMFELRDIYSLYQFIHGKQQASEKKKQKNAEKRTFVVNILFQRKKNVKYNLNYFILLMSLCAHFLFLCV